MSTTDEKNQLSPLTVTTDPDPAAWDAFVHAHPDATGYHTWIWRDVFRKVFGHESIYLAARAEGAIVGILPLVVLDTFLFGRFAVSLPFVNYGGVVASDDRAAEALAKEAARLAAERKWKHVEVRHLDRRLESWAPKQHKVAMTLPLAPAPPPAEATIAPSEEVAAKPKKPKPAPPPLSPEDALFARIDRKVRNQIRKAQKSGFTSAVGGVELAGEFYQVFARTMRDLGTPVYTPRLFEELLRALPDRAKVHVVRLGAEPVAASITIAWRDTVEVPWAASLKEHRSNCPNMLLYWDMLRTALTSGAATFDFGRSTPNEGTFDFKRQWGAEPRPMCWEYWLPPGQSLPDQSPDNPKFAAAVAVWQRLPLPLTKMLGPHIVKGIP
jgi:CelD/BcsL family acetyltransferase involved in cellulose biosynthesis